MEVDDPFGFEDTDNAGPQPANPSPSASPAYTDPSKMIDNEIMALGAPKGKPANPAAPTKKAEPKILGKYASYKDLEKAYTALEKDYTRKSQDLAAISTYKPIFEALEADEGLVSHLKSYLDGSPQERTAKGLGLSPDFRFDANDLADPNSESSRFLNYQIEQRAASKTAQELQRHKSFENLNKQVERMRNDFGLDENEISELLEQGKGRSLTLEDLYLLNNKEAIFAAAEKRGADKLIASRAQRGLPSVAVQGSAPATAQPSDFGSNFINGLLANVGDLDPFS